MSYEPPTPPADLPTDLVNTLNQSNPERLRHAARYAKELAEHKEREIRLEEVDEGDKTEQFPENVPPRATITVKEINDNRYHYWQWRDGEKIKSKYKGPVNQKD